jgi:hypothetical protein
MPVGAWRRSRARGPHAQYRTSRSSPARTWPSIRTEPSTENPPVPRQVRMSATVEPAPVLDVAGDHAIEGQHVVAVVWI